MKFSRVFTRDFFWNFHFLRLFTLPNYTARSILITDEDENQNGESEMNATKKFQPGKSYEVAAIKELPQYGFFCFTAISRTKKTVKLINKEGKVFTKRIETVEGIETVYPAGKDPMLHPLTANHEI